LSEDRATADYFENIISHTGNYKAAANWMLGPVKTWINNNNADIAVFPLAPSTIAELIKMVDSGQVSFSVASGKLFTYLLDHPTASPATVAAEQNLIQQSDAGSLEPIIEEVLLRNADKVKEYKKGKKGLLSLFVGEVMKRSKGKADPRITNEILLEKLKA
jgi:aspartyl-tRNA(Asn)/glutamyl-tRNA(Gln) amidotransferase subunit B